MVDLQKLYHEVLSQYYQTQKYLIPTISWSKEFALFRYGEYQPWKNHIYISKVLNTDKISEMAIKSVIYHELLHQEYVDHDKKFNKKVEMFPDYYIYQKELNDYTNSITDVPLLNPSNNFGEGKKIAFCSLSDENYKNYFNYYNRQIYIYVGKNKKYPDEVLNDSDIFVIWIVLKDGLYYVVGWSDKCELYPNKQEIRHMQFGGLNIEYQIKTKSEDCFILSPENCFCTIPQDCFSETFEKIGAVLANDNNVYFEISEVLENINTYSGEHEVPGLTDDAIYSVYPLAEERSDKIIEESLKYSDYHTLWLANLAAKKDEKFKTIYNQAVALKSNYVLDDAFVTLKKALRLNPNSEETNISLLKLSVMLGKHKEADEFFNKLDKKNILERKDKELSASIKYLNNEIK